MRSAGPYAELGLIATAAGSDAKPADMGCLGVWHATRAPVIAFPSPETLAIFRFSLVLGQLSPGSHANNDRYMFSDLLNRPTPKRSATLRFEGRILYLVDDSALMTAQLIDGHDLELTAELKGKLRDQISTDEITPAYICLFYDETLGDFPYLGLSTVNPETGAVESPVGRNAVRNGGFVCSVAGKRRGKGSSREASPYAELKAGLQVVVAESLERIYNENCQNLGVLTTTDFDIIRRIEEGEEIPLSIFTDGEDEITRQIIEYGGLFEFNVARLQGKATVPAPKCADDDSAPSAPMTLADKIFAKHWVVDAAKGEIGVPWVEPGEARVLPHRHPLLPRVRDPHGGHLLRGEGRRGGRGRRPVQRSPSSGTISHSCPR